MNLKIKFMKLIKTSEAARLIGVTRQAIYYLIKTEKIYFYLVGKRIYIPEDEIDKLLYLLMTADGIESELAADFIDTHKDMDIEPWLIYRDFRKERIAKQLNNKQKEISNSKLKDYFSAVKNLQL